MDKSDLAQVIMGLLMGIVIIWFFGFVMGCAHTQNDFGVTDEWLDQLNGGCVRQYGSSALVSDIHYKVTCFHGEVVE